MREIKRIFVHCTGTAADVTVAAIVAGFKRRGWRNPGYHYVVASDGTVTQLLGEESVANGVRGYNRTSVHVAYIGGLSGGKAVDTRTEAQKASLVTLIAAIHRRYPQAHVMGHRDISPDSNGNGKVDAWERIKECPCFDAISEYAAL